MRKIEKQLIAAIEARKPFTKGNTHYDGFSRVYLFGNLIATNENGLEPGQWQFTLAGWNTPTTRHRLNQLAKAFNRPGVWSLKGQAYTDTGPITNTEWF